MQQSTHTRRKDQGKGKGAPHGWKVFVERDVTKYLSTPYYSVVVPEESASHGCFGLPQYYFDDGVVIPPWSTTLTLCIVRATVLVIFFSQISHLHSRGPA